MRCAFLQVDAQRSGRRVAKLVHILHRAGNLAQRGTDPGEETLPRFRQRDAARRPIDETHAQPFFQPGNGVAQRRR